MAASALIRLGWFSNFEPYVSAVCKHKRPSPSYPPTAHVNRVYNRIICSILSAVCVESGKSDGNSFNHLILLLYAH